MAGNPKRKRNILAYCTAEWYTVSDRMSIRGKEVKDMKMDRRNRIDGSTDIAYCAVLFPDEKQIELILKTFGCKRYIYNRFLSERIEAYQTGLPPVRYIDQANQLPRMKKDPETKWLGEVDSTALQNGTRDLQNAFDNFYKGIKAGRKVGFPKYKRKHDGKNSYRTTNNNDSIRVIDKYHIQLPKLGTVRCKFSRKPKGRILHATVTLNETGEFRISVQCETVLSQTDEKTGRAVGADLGIKNLAVTSDGETYDNPKSYEKNQARLKRLQRGLSRKPKDSKNREKNRKKIAKLHQHIRNQRRDAAHKMTHDLVMKYDYICIEDLRPSEMVKDKLLSKAVSDANFGEIRRQLEYKCAWHHKQLIVVDRWFPSSQTCSECGYENRAVRDLNVRYWKCPHCKAEHDRDVNAAVNILHEGIEKAGLSSIA